MLIAAAPSLRVGFGLAVERALAGFAGDAGEAEELVFPFEDSFNEVAGDGLRLAFDATHAELINEERRDVIQLARVDADLAFGVEDQLDELAGELDTLFVELLPDPFGAFGEEFALELTAFDHDASLRWLTD
jgi:hypothetical protein